MENNQEMLELLRKIERSNRQKVGTNILICIFMLAAAVSCAVLCVMVCRVMPQVNELMGHMQIVLANLEQTTGELSALDLEAMVSNVDSLVLYAQDSLQQTMDKLNTIDFETLNKAIGDLSKVIEPLANFARMFG